MISLEKLFNYVMYALFAATFLNQSILSVNIGFFTLFLYRILLILALAIYVSYAFYKKRIVSDFQESEIKPVWIFLFGWIAYGSISLLWSASIIESIKYMSLLFMGVAFVYLACITFKTVMQLQRILQIWLGMSILLMGIGFINHLFSIQLPSSSLYGASSFKLAYPTSVFFNQNDFATFLGITFFMFVSVLKNGKNKWISSLSFLFSVLSIYLIYLTESRASILAILVGLFVYLFLLTTKRIKRLLVICFIGIALIGIVLFGEQIITKIQSMNEIAESTYQTTEPLPSNIARVNLLKNTFYYVIDTYGFGVGAGNIPYYLEFKSYFPTGNVLQVHNWIAEIAGNFGVIIVLGYIGMILYSLISMYRIYEKVHGWKDKMLLEASLVGMISFLISSISPSSVMNLYFHWVFLGFFLSVLTVYSKAMNGNRISIVERMS